MMFSSSSSEETDPLFSINLLMVILMLPLFLYSRQKTTGKGIETKNEKEEEDVVNREVNKVEVFETCVDTSHGYSIDMKCN